METPILRLEILIWILAVLVLTTAYLVWQNNAIVVSSSDYCSSRIPAAYDDFKIVQISDLHNKTFGKGQSKLLGEVESLSPDIIVITGDLIDRRRFDLEAAMCFIDGAVKIAPTYYVSGNHEAWSRQWSEISRELIAAGVHIMDDSADELTKDGETIQILGLSDPGFRITEFPAGNTEEQLKQWSGIDEFKILLTHRAELFDLYSKNNIDLIFTGHAHGGQLRIPFIGGVFSPHQGLLPEYSIGNYCAGSSTMYVSRGLGNSVFPFRINNRPEIVAITLKCAE